MSVAYFEIGIDILMALLSISLMICFLRLYHGPHMPDRTVAFDLISIHAVGLFGLSAIHSQSVVMLEGAIVPAILGFLGTVMLARFLERSGGDSSDTSTTSTPATPGQEIANTPVPDKP